MKYNNTKQQNMLIKIWFKCEETEIVSTQNNNIITAIEVTKQFTNGRNS